MDLYTGAILFAVLLLAGVIALSLFDEFDNEFEEDDDDEYV